MSRSSEAVDPELAYYSEKDREFLAVIGELTEAAGWRMGTGRHMPGRWEGRSPGDRLEKEEWNFDTRLPAGSRAVVLRFGYAEARGPLRQAVRFYAAGGEPRVPEVAADFIVNNATICSAKQYVLEEDGRGKLVWKLEKELVQEVPGGEKLVWRKI